MRQAHAYLELTKPGITAFIGITAAAGFITAAGGTPDSMRLLTLLLATMLMSGGAATLNHVAEHELDALMRRTAARPIPAGLVSVGRGAAFGWGLSVAALALSLAFLPLATTLCLVVCHLSYVFVYTPLKRRTPLCTLAGAIPGAVPVLAGWTAAGRGIDAAAIALTGVLFMWQIPHFLAIGWLARDDYRRAGCSMLGVIEGTARTSARVSLAYACAMFACAAVLAAAASAGALYLVAVLTTGLAYVAAAWAFNRRPERAPARRLFFSSLVVLPVLLTALMADVLLTA